jgi:hypothetical protein
MPFCPNCHYEYVEGVSTCLGCSAPLSSGALPPERESTPEVEYVRLTTFPDPSAALVVKAGLAEAGISAILQMHGPISGELARATFGASEDYAILLVPEDCLAEAQRLLQALASGPVE